MKFLFFFILFAYLSSIGFSLQLEAILEKEVLEFKLNSGEKSFLEGKIIFTPGKIEIPFIKNKKIKFSGSYSEKDRKPKFCLELKEVDFKEIAIFFGFRKEELEGFSCKITGFLKITPQGLDLFFKSQEGVIFGDKFKYAQIKGKGAFNNFILENSYLEKLNGAKIFIKGIVNFEDLKESLANLKIESESVELLKNLRLTSFKGKVYFLKGERGDLEIWPIFYDKQESPESWELKYKLDENDFLKIRFSDQDTILGFEKRFKF